MSFNDKMYSLWMDCSIQKDKVVLMGCGHWVSRDDLAKHGGICPQCEMDADSQELGDWPDHQAVEELPGELDDEPAIGSEEFWRRENDF